MAIRTERLTVDLSGFPDLVVILLGMRANSLRGVKTLLSFGPKIRAAVNAKPDGLLLHENLIYSLFPPHLGMRQYWRDFDSLEAWTRELPHREWWRNFLDDPGGTTFWHEAYFRRAAWKRSTSLLKNHRACRNSHPSNLQKVPCFRRAGGRDSVESFGLQWCPNRHRMLILPHKKRRSAVKSAPLKRESTQSAWGFFLLVRTCTTGSIRIRLIVFRVVLRLLMMPTLRAFPAGFRVLVSLGI